MLACREASRSQGRKHAGQRSEAQGGGAAGAGAGAACCGAAGRLGEEWRVDGRWLHCTGRQCDARTRQAGGQSTGGGVVELGFP
ncbi:hypothetical protein CCHR01_15703 [Colletotrichum chrysophilum]|uniref:Uncharacterized protein n=1 Tax=Colletotrichum chrysophilum TaxID=1836956 RepID=A0AAD9E8F3_9PEZI|nr:hypothetical protein CCHR01_15703 [Colletotrichum chrysophilum]